MEIFSYICIIIFIFIFIFIIFIFIFIIFIFYYEELGRHRGREGKTECCLCGDECENLSRVFWECSTYI